MPPSIHSLMTMPMTNMIRKAMATVFTALVMLSSRSFQV